jgi:uncharacterized membrane protein
MAIMSVSLALHALAAVIWVGGMAFAYFFLRPAAQTLQAPQRQELWRAVLARFFIAIWIAIAVLLLTGYHMTFAVFGGFGAVGIHVHVMNGLGILMMLIFAHVFFVPWRRYCKAFGVGDHSAAAAQLDIIRKLIALNLVLGLIVIVAGASGRYWS